MFRFRNDTRFIEYPKASAGQYSIKVEYKLETKEDDKIKREWIPIGYITKKFNKEENKYFFYATDTKGNLIYQNSKDLYVLKMEFRTNGKKLAKLSKSAQIVRTHQNLKIGKTETVVHIQKEQRNKDVQNLRGKSEGKTKNPKAEYNRIEKEMDAKNHEKDDEIKSETNQAIEKPEQDIVSERMDELENLREQGEDMEQGLEMDR